MKSGVINRLFTVVAFAAGILNASGVAASFGSVFFPGLVFLVLSVLLAVLLLKRDCTPCSGTVFVTSALLVTCVQLWGGAAGPAAFLYPVLFLWIKRTSIAGPVLKTASAIAVIEFLAPLVKAAGLVSGDFNVSSMLDVLFTALAAGLIPLVSLTLVEFLKEEKKLNPADPGSSEGDKEGKPGFPDDIARSLIPVLRHGTGANGIFLFKQDDRGIVMLDEFDVSSGRVFPHYMAGPDDPVIRILDSSRGDMLHTTAGRMSIGGCAGLPWYDGDSRHPFVTLLQFRRSGKLHGFMVLDFDSEKAREHAASLLVDIAFLLSVAWERSRETGTAGFFDICDEMAVTTDIKGAVHRLVSAIIRLYPDTTASVAILGEGRVLRIFESLGSFSEGRAGREFNDSEGFAGMAVKRREPLRRLRMGVGQKAVRTFGDSDDPRRIVGSCCAVPLEDMGAVLGVLTVESESEQFFAPEDLNLFIAFATVFSLAVSRNNLLGTLHRVKANDRITELPLLSHFQATLADMVRGVQSRAWSITVLAVDINGFSRLNESYGYLAGDAVLETTARRLRKAVGGDAVLSRCGADEFLVCLQGVDRVSAEAYAARIHQEFDDTPFSYKGRQIPVRVCIGGAVSHVDRMIRRLPGIALGMVAGISGYPGMSSITEVGQFFDAGK